MKRSKRLLQNFWEYTPPPPTPIIQLTEEPILTRLVNRFFRVQGSVKIQSGFKYFFICLDSDTVGDWHWGCDTVCDWHWGCDTVWNVPSPAHPQGANWICFCFLFSNWKKYLVFFSPNSSQFSLLRIFIPSTRSSLITLRDSLISSNRAHWALSFGSICRKRLSYSASRAAVWDFRPFARRTHCYLFDKLQQISYRLVNRELKQTRTATPTSEARKIFLP